jgi:hypothetical protein
MSRNRRHANALVLIAIVVIVAAVIVLAPVMIITALVMVVIPVLVTMIIPAMTIMFLVTRNVLAVLPVILHKEDPLAAGMVCAAVFAPVFCLTRRYAQIDRRAIPQYPPDCRRMTVDELWRWIVGHVESTIVVGLANAGVTLVSQRLPRQWRRSGLPRIVNDSCCISCG